MFPFAEYYLRADLDYHRDQIRRTFRHPVKRQRTRSLTSGSGISHFFHRHAVSASH